MSPLIITLDGPAGSGKSTVARLLAGRLGLEFLDTGAMYRAIAVLTLDDGVDAADPAAMVAIAEQTLLRFDWRADPPRIFADHGGRERDVTPRLRDRDVTSRTSEVAAIGGVRRVLVEEQRRIALAHPRIVSEGRDQGSVVFPDAQVKFYLDAPPQVRARRRAEQLREAGKPIDEAQILDDIQRRDHRDANRPDGPLICPHDAERVDTSGMSLAEVVDLLERHVHERLGEGRMTKSE